MQGWQISKKAENKVGQKSSVYNHISKNGGNICRVELCTVYSLLYKNSKTINI